MMHHASVIVVLNFQMSMSELELHKVNVDEMSTTFL
jgi:hypothetical protein